MAKPRPSSSSATQKSKSASARARKSSSGRAVSGVRASSAQSWLQLGQLRSEKCELLEAKIAFEMALQEARDAEDLKSTMEAIAGLLRLAGEGLDEQAMEHWDRELDALMAAYPRQIPAMAWYCKGVVARHQQLSMRAQRYLHNYLRAVRKESKPAPEALAKGWVMLAAMLWQRGHLKRAQLLTHELLRRHEPENLKGINGILYLVLGNIDERDRKYDSARQWYQKAHGSFLGEHNWYYHLYVLYGYARLSRHQQNYSEAYWYLNLMEKACSGPEFGLLLREIARERDKLAADAVDLVIDSRHCTVQTRENRSIALGKQYVLLDILQSLSDAHGREGDDADRGLSKAEIIERVWKENYRPEAHDNKLYYNINRLRKLIEPDVKNPQYLLNWKEGYRLAPGLRIQFIGGKSADGTQPRGGVVLNAGRREKAPGREHRSGSPRASTLPEMEVSE